MTIKSIILFLLSAVTMLGSAAIVAVLQSETRFPSIRASLEYWEGVRYTPYADPARPSHMIVGIGHNLTGNNQVVMTSRKYTKTEVDSFYRVDLSNALRAARAGVTDFDQLDDQVKQVVINLIWTVGPSGFESFINFRKALSNRHYRTAANELASSRWATQVSRARVEWSVGVLKSAGNSKL